MQVTAEMIPGIVAEARAAAEQAATDFYENQLGGRDSYACGFAWVNIYGVKMNTKLGKAFKALGLDKDYSGAICWWNPSNMGAQNIDTKEVGANAAAKVLQKYGFSAYSNSRLD